MVDATTRSPNPVPRRSPFCFLGDAPKVRSLPRHDPYLPMRSQPNTMFRGTRVWTGFFVDAGFGSALVWLSSCTEVLARCQGSACDPLDPLDGKQQRRIAPRGEDEREDQKRAIRRRKIRSFLNRGLRWCYGARRSLFEPQKKLTYLFPALRVR